jgi:hypothetical protein
MKSVRFRASFRTLLLLTICLGAAGWATPQQTNSPRPPDSPTVIARLVNFSGTVKDSKGSPVTGSVNLTFSLYSYGFTFSGKRVL